ncbi:aminoglycoside phosphotransferase family protein [Pseudomonas syringae]|nr:aminoglycoside phosphotransferase family protein [Pseudomonas syringae]
MSKSTPEKPLNLTNIKNTLNEQFQIGATAVELFVRGINYTFKITCRTKKYYFKVFSTSRTVTDISFEISVTHTLLNNNIGVARIVKSIHGHSFIKIRLADEDRLGILYNDVEGRPLLNNATDISLFSAAIAKIHGLPTLELSQCTSRIFCIEKECSRLQGLLKNNTLAPKTLILKMIENCNSIQDEALRDCNVLSHGDAWLGNARLTNERVYFIDLEDAVLADRHFDLGVMAYHLIAKHCEVSGCIASLLQRYNNLSPTRVTLRTLKPYIQLRSLFVFCLLLENDLISEQLLPRLIERADYFTSEAFSTQIAHVNE